MAESQFSENRGRISPDLEPRNQQNGQSVSSHNSPTITHTGNQLVPWLGNLQPHPSYARLGIKVPASRLNALLEMGEDAFLFPLIVTSDGIVIDGYARLEVARLQGRTTVECIESNISEEEALLIFRQIETEHDSNGDMRNRFHTASSFTLRPASTEKYE